MPSLGERPKRHQEIRQFAHEIGLAFQIQDDILDLTTDPMRLGKPAGNDLRQGTVTLPTLLFAQRDRSGSAEPGCSTRSYPAMMLRTTTSMT